MICAPVNFNSFMGFLLNLGPFWLIKQFNKIAPSISRQLRKKQGKIRYITVELFELFHIIFSGNSMLVVANNCFWYL